MNLTTGIPANGAATIRIGDGPALTYEQLHWLLIFAGHPRAEVAAQRMLKGTAYQTVVQRTARDVLNKMEVAELREQQQLLLRALRTKLSPLWLRALDALIDWHFVSTLSEELGVSVQQTGNVCAALFAIGLLERRDAPRHLRGRSPLLYRSVDAVHGAERLAKELATIRAAADPQAEPDAPSAGEGAGGQ